MMTESQMIEGLLWMFSVIGGVVLLMILVMGAVAGVAAIHGMIIQRRRRRWFAVSRVIS
jgi:UPF0716 family protein affecting phage T7 exclusion